MSMQEGAVVLSIEHVGKSFTDGQGLHVLDDISLEISAGEFVSIIGPSGCGKSTLLKMVAGLLPASKGKILFQGNEVMRPGPERGVVFQEARLFPWLTVEENIAFGLPADTPQDEIERMVVEHIHLVGLDGFALAYPSQLSGGMQQRCSIARTLVGNPRLLLLDEPFGALDAMTRIKMQQEITRIWQMEGMTILLITHDIDEALFLSDRVVAMSDRPASVKDIFKIGLARPRDRNSPEFMQLRRKLYEEFFS